MEDSSTPTDQDLGNTKEFLSRIKEASEAREEAMAKVPKPPKHNCLQCGNEVGLQWGGDGWSTPDIHLECEELLKRYDSIGIDRRFYNLPEFHVEAGNKTAWEAISDFIKNPRDKGLFLFGPAGVGKTLLLSKIAQEAKVNTRLIKIPRLLMTMRNNLDGNGWKNELLIGQLSKLPLLLMDDLGAEKASEWVSEIIYLLIDERYGKMLPTVITSNYPLDVIAERLGDRIASRLVETCRIIEINTTDKRQENAQRKAI